MSIELHGHALFSIDGAGTPEALVDHAVQRGVSVWAITEHNHDCYRHQFEQLFPVIRDLGFPWTREDLDAFLPECYPTHPAPVLNRYVLIRYVEAHGWSGDIRARC